MVEEVILCYQAGPRPYVRGHDTAPNVKAFPPTTVSSPYADNLTRVPEHTCGSGYVTGHPDNLT